MFSEREDAKELDRMELTYEDLGDGIRRVKLAGRLDVEGSHEIDLKFTSLTASRQAFVIVDLSLVEFLSSLGLGTLVRSAKAQMSRQGRMVLLSPQPHVARVLQTTQVDQIVQVFYDFEKALDAVRPAAGPAL
jgi:anti-sigma B factor antagonist